MIDLNLHIDEVNLILAALSKAPYEQVAGLVQKIRGQAGPQFEAIQAQAQAEAEVLVTSAKEETVQ